MRQISNDRLKDYVTGAVYFKEEDDGLIPYRFSEEKLVSTKGNLRREIRHYGAAGIRIDFFSDTEKLHFGFTAYTGFSCKTENYNLYFFDVYVDNELILHQGEKNLSADIAGVISLKLKPGVKRITIYLPAPCSVKISDFYIDKQACMNKVEYSQKALFLGDSITHAAYLDFPSLNYANIIARRFNYHSVNQAIGGDVFDKKHLLYASVFKPDIIFVAYGTNDWRGATTNENCIENVGAYFRELTSLYDKAEINVILPIWRKDKIDYPELKYSFIEVRNMIREVAEKYDAHVLDGMDFVPQSERMFWDGYLHPNEMGFLYYADSLENWINKISKESEKQVR